MSLSNFIKTTTLSFCLLGLSVSAAQARNLTSQEQSVCASLRACIDIVRRHDASEFDYNVLGVQFRRFGSAGKAALFGVLESDDGQADIARMISSLGPLTPQDRQRVRVRWSQEKAQSYLPLLLDGHPMSRDLLLQTLGHPSADVREQVRVALIKLPEFAQNAPLVTSLQKPLLSALQQDPISQAAPYLERLNAAGQEAHFAALLRSGESDIVSAAYNALYRNSPAKAFNALLAEMKNMKTPVQTRAVGQMLATRHKTRPDGFYLKFARDMSGDAKLPISARASGLHGFLTIADGPFPDLTPMRAEALSFLVSGQPLVVQDKYLPYLKAVGAEAAMDLIWKTAQREKWINRDRIAEFYLNQNSNDAITVDLIQSDDLRSFLAGLRRSKPSHARFIRAQIDHPIKAIATAARQKFGLSTALAVNRECPIKAFDLDDMQAQMPFFDSGWMIADNQARVSVSRSQLITAHPSSTGWLAGYDLKKPGSRSIYSGGSILHYNNTSGAFERLGNFTGPRAILPSQPLQLGQTTKQFWIVDVQSNTGSAVSAYDLDLTGSLLRVTHIGVLPITAHDFSVASNGDLLVLFVGGKQAPIRLAKSGQMSLACSVSRQHNAPRAPQ